MSFNKKTQVSVKRIKSLNVSELDRRRALLALAGNVALTPVLGPLAGSSAVAASDDAPPNRFPRMVHEWFVGQVQKRDGANRKRFRELKSKSQAQQLVESARQRCRRAFGPVPKKTPLNARITGTVDRDTYKIENIIFDSRPGFPVTANLYLPKNVDSRLPAVVGTCGHSTNGKAAEAYQSYAQGLARIGIACLIYDPIGQGERLQYTDEELKSTVGVGVREHLYAGNQQFLVGEFFGNWRAWDGIRALDYLLTRSDIDPRRIGVTGNSGGGTMTTWLCGLDQRWAMGAPSCFVTTFLRNLENELPQDTEQCPPNVFPLGLDHSDFLAAMAPKPVIILAKERDYFDVRGSEETYRRLRRLYRALGAEQNIALFVGPTGHGYSQENREAMYSWFSRAVGFKNGEEMDALDGVLKTAAKMRSVSEPKISIEKDETLRCTPEGQVATLDGTRTVFDFTKESSEGLAKSRAVLRGDELGAAIKDVLKIATDEFGKPDHRNFRYLQANDYPRKHAIGYTVPTERGINAIVYRLTDERWHSRPPVTGEDAILYVSHLSADAELRNEPLIRQLIDENPDAPLFTCDVRGIGESLPGTSQPGTFHSPYGSDYFYAIHSIMLGRPYVGQKTIDVLRVIAWLESYGHTNIHLAGLGWGALPATFAGVLSMSVKNVTLKNALTSYADIAQSEHYDWPLSTLVPGILKRFDLPDCYAELKSKQLRQIDPKGAM